MSAEDKAREAEILSEVGGKKKKSPTSAHSALNRISSESAMCPLSCLGKAGFVGTRGLQERVGYSWVY